MWHPISRKKLKTQWVPYLLGSLGQKMALWKIALKRLHLKTFLAY
jgi:hypothetical protein